MKVRYLGTKDQKADNVAGSGAVWMGNGDVQEVPDAAWAALSRHPGVWERVDEQAQNLPKFSVTLPGGVVVDLDVMDNEALRGFCAAQTPPLDIDGRKKEGSLRAAIVAAFESATDSAE